jgi:hypothetical protein
MDAVIADPIVRSLLEVATPGQRCSHAAADRVEDGALYCPTCRELIVDEELDLL